jgi:M6 family metalloprotease-like protein
MTVPYAGRTFTFAQPDGTALTVRGFGDQYGALFRTLDGRAVARNPATRFFEYAVQDAGNVLRLTGLKAGIDSPPAEIAPIETLEIGKIIKANVAGATAGLPLRRPRWQDRADRKRRRNVPAGVAALNELMTVAQPDRSTIGNYCGLCVLVQFPDAPGTIPQGEVAEFLNGDNYTGFGNNGSVKNYFNDVSGGRLQYTSVTTPYVTTRYTRSYYVDPDVPYPERAQLLVTEVLEYLMASGFDFSSLSVADGGFIRAVNIYYSGPCVNGYVEGLWPHSSRLETQIEVAPGRYASDYQISNVGDELSLGTYCHENGHMVCDFPDLYDTDQPGQGNPSAGIGYFCLMSAGGGRDPRNPPQIGAYLKHRAGWSDSVVPMVPGDIVELNGTGNHFCMHAKDAQEYFILEYRHQSGRDAAIPGSGLAIWHVDEQGRNSYEQGSPDRHYECALMQADGRRDLEHNRNPGDDLDLYPAGGNTRFANTTVPDSRWWDGSSSGVDVQGIQLTPAGVRFRT